MKLAGSLVIGIPSKPKVGTKPEVLKIASTNHVNVTELPSALPKHFK